MNKMIERVSKKELERINELYKQSEKTNKKEILESHLKLKKNKTYTLIHDNQRIKVRYIKSYRDYILLETLKSKYKTCVLKVDIYNGSARFKEG